MMSAQQVDMAVLAIEFRWQPSEIQNMSVIDREKFSALATKILRARSKR